MKTRFPVLAALLLATLFVRSQTTVTFTNPTGLQRHEVVEISLADIRQPKPFIVTDAFGIEQPYQLTADGQLLLFVAVRPHGKAVYTLRAGSPKTFKPYVFTQMYPQRLDDIVIENDRTGYRFYGPSLQRKGEKGYGIDVWIKNTPELIIDSLYRLDRSLHAEQARLHKQGRHAQADSLQTITSFHLNHGMGMDCYGVGPSLGCGTPALLDGNSLLFPWCYSTYRIIENGPLRVSVLMEFAPADKGSRKQVVEHRIATLDRGSNFCRMKVWYTGLQTPADVAAGFAIRAADTESVVCGQDYIHYADPTTDPERQNCQIYVATLFPYGISQTRRIMFSKPQNGNAGHAVGIRRSLRNGEAFTYFFGSAWSEYDVRSQEEWQLRINQTMTSLRSPLQCTVSTASDAAGSHKGR